MALSTNMSTRLEYQYKSIFALFEGLSDEAIRTHIIPGKWSAFENVVHLATYQHVFLDRMHRILKSEAPLFDRYVPDTDPFFVEHCGKVSADIVKDLLATRRKIVQELAALPDEALERVGVHPNFGPLTIAQWTEFFLLHEAHHLFTLFKLTSLLRKEGIA